MSTVRLAAILAFCVLLHSLVTAGIPSGRARVVEHAVQTGSPAVQAARLVTRWTIIVTERFEASRAFKSDATDELVDQFISTGAVRAVEDKVEEDKLRAADAAID